MSEQQIPEFPAIWYTSGTVINTGQRDCAYKRWLGYHAGRHGTGYTKHGTAVPLATGSGVHRGMELIGGWILDWQAAHQGYQLLPDNRALDEVIAWAAAEAADGYAAKARARGLELTKTDLNAAAAVEQLIVEQRTLIEAQVWVYALGRLPIMLADYRLINVEFDESPVIDCTCGLGDWVADAATHAQRGCAGICAMGKADFLWERINDGKIVYEEFKTKATPNYGWEQQWEHSGQLLLNMESASRRLGKEVSEAFVPVLFKGKRDRTDRSDPQSPKIQQSPLVYGWFDPGNGMTRDAEWSAQYEWYDDYGKKHRLGGMFKRTGVWLEAVELPLANPNGVAFRDSASRIERWVKGWILPAMYPKLLQVLGPFQKPRARVPDAVVSLLAEERRWRDDVELLRRLGVWTPTDQGYYFDHDAPGEGLVSVPGEERRINVTAADVIPRSWNCTSFDGTPCMFRWVCFREPGSESGIDSEAGKLIYEIRTPHHPVEQAVMTPRVEALGLAWRDEDEEEGE